MHTLEDELELEAGMINAGRAIFHARNKRAESTGNVMQTSYARRLAPSSLQAMLEYFNTSLSAKHRGLYAKYMNLVKQIPTELFCSIVLQNTIGSLVSQLSVQNVAANIGKAVETEVKVNKFKEDHEESYKIILEELRKTRTKSVQHRHRVLNLNANNSLEWVSWSLRERVSVGMIGIKMLLASTELMEIQNIRGMLYLQATESCNDWVKRHKDFASMLTPKLTPCIIPPMDWESFSIGGYHSPKLRSLVEMVKCKTKEQRAALRDIQAPEVFSAMNALQRTEWEINTEVFNVLKLVWEKGLGCGLPSSEPLQIPVCPMPPELKKSDMSEEQLEIFSEWKREAAQVYTDDKRRIAHGFGVIGVINIANKYLGKSVYFPYQADFRSRLYAVCPVLNPQGQDYSKALLRFKKGKPITKSGEKWFLILGANKYGFDKLPLEERIQKIKELHMNIIMTAEQPLANRDFWANAEDPWQFLAWCFEYKRYTKDGVDTISHLPVGLDGTCNGLQHYSAMLRDAVGGAAVNLSDSDSPADIYNEVALVLENKLKLLRNEPSDEFSQAWLDFGITRSLCKKPVMTMPYGSTRRACTDSIYDYVREHPNRAVLPRFIHKAVQFLSNLLWDSIGEVVIAARKGMDWLKSVGSQLLKETSGAFTWTTPIGFKVIQDERLSEEIEVISSLDNKRRSFILQRNTDEISKPKMRQGISPNFVHSMDATHMMMCINKAHACGIDSFACIHDDYGVHACDTAKFFDIIREQFVELYKINPLQRFKKQQEEEHCTCLPDLPDEGCLNISDVLTSKYFFA